MLRCILRTTMLLLLALLASGCKKNESSYVDPCLSRARFGPPSTSAYVLPYPVGSRYVVLQSYCGPYSHNQSNQLAYDLTMNIGSPVTAARAGQVVLRVELYEDTDRDPNHFNYLLIRHDDGTTAFYAHLRLGSFCVQLGDWVQTGQHIADSGSCGTPVADLHFGVYRTSDTLPGDDLPVNFRNASGTLDERGGLLAGETYLALAY